MFFFILHYYVRTEHLVANAIIILSTCQVVVIRIDGDFGIRVRYVISKKGKLGFKI